MYECLVYLFQLLHQLSVVQNISDTTENKETNILTVGGDEGEESKPQVCMYVCIYVCMYVCMLDVTGFRIIFWTHFIFLS